MKEYLKQAIGLLMIFSPFTLILLGIPKEYWGIFILYMGVSIGFLIIMIFGFFLLLENKKPQ